MVALQQKYVSSRLDGDHSSKAHSVTMHGPISQDAKRVPSVAVRLDFNPHPILTEKPVEIPSESLYSQNRITL